MRRTAFLPIFRILVEVLIIKQKKCLSRQRLRLGIDLEGIVRIQKQHLKQLIEKCIWKLKKQQISLLFVVPYFLFLRVPMLMMKTTSNCFPMQEANF